jgi:hypothetical protein
MNIGSYYIVEEEAAARAAPRSVRWIAEPHQPS